MVLAWSVVVRNSINIRVDDVTYIRYTDLKRNKHDNRKKNRKYQATDRT